MVQRNAPSAQVSEMLMRNYEREKNSYIFGVPITAFTKEELIGALIYMNDEREEIMQEHSRTLDFLLVSNVE